MSTITAQQQQQGSNETAFEAAFQRYHALIVRFAYSRTHDLDLAEDIAQETFLKAFRAWARLRPDSSIKCWLGVIASNTIRDHIRHRQRAGCLSLENGSDEHGQESALIVEDPFESQPCQQDIQQALGRLPMMYRNALLLYVLGFSYQEAADKEGITLWNYKTRMVRARFMLREDLKWHEFT